MLSRCVVLMLLALVGASNAATHVNISIGQQPATNPADVSYIDGEAPAELRAGPDRAEEQRFARLQERPQQQQQQQQQQPQQQQQQQQQPQQPQQPQQFPSQQSLQPEQQPQSPRQGLGLQPTPAAAPGRNHNYNGRPSRRRGHSRRPSLHQQPPHNGQFRQRNQQLRQNQEFERYIQSYHSHGPSVETVFESSSPAPQRYTQSGSDSSSSVASEDVVSIGGGKSQQLRMFERQVAAPVAPQGQSANVEQPQDSKPIYEPQAPAPVQTASIAPSSSSSSASAGKAPAPAPAAPSASNDAKLGSGSYDSSYDPSYQGSYDPSFDAGSSYNQPSYDQHDFNYDAAPDDYQDQYPPSVDESSTYDDYGDQLSGPGYLPPSHGYIPPAPPRPIITKTIQIVQPALKAKKYEVRHPAIQKEFYDIEERVVIKPAGTLIVELDHPVAKIPRGETLLPLGHPHPAVASAYNNNGQVHTESYNNNANDYRPAYEPSPAPKEQAQVTTLGSTVTTMPTYDQAPKDQFVEAQLQQQPQPQGNDATDGIRQSAPNSNSGSPSNSAPAPASSSSSSSNSSPSVSVSATDSNGNQFQFNKKQMPPKTRPRPEQDQDYDYGRSEARYPPQRSYQRPNHFNRQPYANQNDDDYFSGEFLPNVNAANVESKPARLEEEPRPQIVKHEHKIHLPPSQHNIYFGRNRQPPPKERRISEAQVPLSQEVPAHVAELKPYLRNHVGPTVVYAKPVARPVPPRGYYHQASRQRSPLAEDLEYSAPYSRMRYEPESESESGRLVEAPKEQKEQKEQKEPTKAHIHLKIPNHDDEDQSIVATATIRPAKPDCDQKQQAQDEDQVDSQRQPQQQFQRLIESPASSAASSPVVEATQATPSPTQPKLDVDVSLNGGAGHLNRHLQPNERVISATAAPTDASATSETFHKRRIVVNHPFQTVREVVEHEPITNYHQIQVNEPASPTLYHQAAYYQQPVHTHGNLVEFKSTSTHGNLHARYG